MSTAAVFDGFGPDAAAFLDGLAADNSTAYFEANRRLYGEQVASPLKELVVAVGEQLSGVIGHELAYAPRIGRSLFRINRDLRFSNDKTPYRTHLDAIWWTGDVPKQSAAFILRIRSDSVLTGAGMHGLAGDALERYRAAVVSAAGAGLADVVASLEADLGAGRSEPNRRRVPKGLPADHPRADLLLRDGFHVSVEEALPDAFTSAAFAPWVANRLARFAAVQAWFVEHV